MIKKLEEKFDKIVNIYRIWYAVMVLSGAALFVAGMTQAECWWMMPTGIFVGKIGTFVVDSLFQNYLNELIMIVDNANAKVEA